jgi:hypothetical protein
MNGIIDPNEPASPAAIPHVEETLAEASIGGWVLAGWGLLSGALGAGAAFLMPHAPVAAIVLGGLSGASTLRTVALGRRRVRAGAEVLHVRGLLGEMELRYKDIDTVRFDVDTQQHPADFNARLRFSGLGQSMSLRWLQAAPAAMIGRYVAGRVVPRLVDEAVRTLLAGGTIKIGKHTTVSRAGFVQKGKEVRFHEVDRIDRSPKGFRIFPKNRPGDVMIVAVSSPQMPLVFALVEAMQERTQPGPAREVVVEGFAARDARLGKLICGRANKPQQRQRVGVGTLAVTSALAAVAGLAVQQGDDELAVITGVFAGGVALVGGIVWLSMRNGALGIYENGVTNGRVTIAWADATSVMRSMVDQYVNGAYTGRVVNVVVTSAAGTIKFGGNTEEIEALSDVLLQHVVPAVAAKRVSEIKQLKEVVVAGITFDASGIRYKRKHLRYADIEHLEAQQGYLHVWTDVRSKSDVSVSLQDKNGWVAVEVLQQMVNAARSKVPTPAVDVAHPHASE